MNNPLAQIQQQLEAAQAQNQDMLLKVWVLVICLNVLGAYISFLIARWFLLHVLAIQQKRFFAQLDLFLCQRGLAPHVSEPVAAGPGCLRRLGSRIKAIAKNLRAQADRFAEPNQNKPSLPATPRQPASRTRTFADKTPMEQAWQQLIKPTTEPSPDDSRYRPKG